MAKVTLTKDFANTDIQVDRFFAIRGVDALGWLETTGPDWSAFKADGSFLGWFRSRRLALAAIS